MHGVFFCLYTWGMNPNFVLAGKLNREYILPFTDLPRLDAPGGSLLYAAGGLAIWSKKVGLLARVSESYPDDWLQEFEQLGFDIEGIRKLKELDAVDFRSFTAFNEFHERSNNKPVSHFARRQMAFPKTLLGYQAPDEGVKDSGKPDPASPSILDTPANYRQVQNVHLCPFDFFSQSQLVNLYHGHNQTISLDPSPGYMMPKFWRDIRIVLQGVTVFEPAEEDLRALFWGETDNLWDMAEQVSSFGPRLVVIKCGIKGQMLYDADGKRRYEIPAYPARVVDLSGAGDAFCGGFLAGFVETGDPLMGVLHGNVSASITIEGSGPFYALGVMPGLAQARLFSLQESVRQR